MTNIEITTAVNAASLIGRYVVETTEEDTLVYTVASISRGWMKLTTEDGVTRNIRPTELETDDELELMDAGWTPDADESADDEPEADDEESTSKMATQLRKYRETYVTSVAPSGRKSLSNGDELAQALEGLDLSVLYNIVATVLEVDCTVKYASLNKGSQRMNLGNRMRAAYKSEAHVHHAAVVAWVKAELAARNA